MPYPEPEILTNLVSRVFQIDDMTLGDKQRGWMARYRGLLTIDSLTAYDQLDEAVKPHGLTPLFRKEGARHVIVFVPSLPEVKKRTPTTNIVMFILTVLSVLLAGIQLDGPLPTDAKEQMLVILKNLWTGWPFAASLLGILLAHEFGHYLMSRYHKTAATLPFFIPFPGSAFGTLGAFIQLQAIPKNKRVLFDIGVAGPLAGIVVAIPILFIGLRLSTLGIVENVPSTLEGNSILYLLSKFVVFHQLLPAPADTHGVSLALYWLQYFFTGTPLPIGGTDVFIHPVAFAGWAGLLVTALNLIPVGTLDGGHVSYSMFGEKTRLAYPVIFVALIGLGFFWNGWWLWAALLYFLGGSHAEPLDQISELDSRRKWVGALTLILFVLTFSPVPMVILGQ